MFLFCVQISLTPPPLQLALSKLSWSFSRFQRDKLSKVLITVGKAILLVLHLKKSKVKSFKLFWFRSSTCWRTTASAILQIKLRHQSKCGFAVAKQIVFPSFDSLYLWEPGGATGLAVLPSIAERANVWKEESIFPPYNFSIFSTLSSKTKVECKNFKVSGLCICSKSRHLCRILKSRKADF